MNVLQYIEKASREYPNKTAVSSAEQSFTFAELRASAGVLAARLYREGSGRPIGVFANRTAATAVWYLAVLYSGNHYVPLDPDVPTDKLKAIIDDCGLVTIIGDDCNTDKVRDAGFVEEFIIPDEPTGGECDALSEIHHVIDDDDPAYIIYTSGSTGKPKGVVKSHGAICSYIEAFCETFDFSPDEVIGNQTPFFFDASAKDFYLMLKTGATLDIIPTERFSLPTELIEYMNEKKITFASWVPTAVSLVAMLCPFSLVKPIYLRRLFFVGEVMPMKHLNKWRRELPELQYVNLYGQTELAGICCYYEVDREFSDSDVLPIGKPLGNCRVYLVDDDRVINEIGRIGELYIAGPALASGYYNDPEKNRECFIMRDFGNGEERCFRTGDLAQYNEFGELVFAARVDYQIKHMGHRIELGEIEAVAGALDEIARCCCLYNSEKRRIVLICQLSEGCKLSGKELQSILRGRMSGYMVPGKVVILDKLPLNANGKIDRQALRSLV